MVVRNREARIRQALTSAPRSGRNGAKRRGELWSCRQGRERRIVRSIRLRIATKELPENAAFEAQAHRLRRQSAGTRPATTAGIPGRAFRCSAHDIGLQRLPMTTSGSEPARYGGSAAVVGEGSTRGGASGAPLVPVLARSMQAWIGRGRGLTAPCPVARQGSGDAAVRIP